MQSVASSLVQRTGSTAGLWLFATLLSATASAQVGTVDSHQKISATTGGFGGTLEDEDYFGRSVASIGDLDGDGVDDLAVGADGDDDGAFRAGAVWILFLDTDGTVKSEQKISATSGGFTGLLDSTDYFGRSVAAIGDLDGDGVEDVAVGAPGDDDGGGRAGAVWILFLDTDGTVKSHQKISSTEGGFGGSLDAQDYFGKGLAFLGPLDGDAVGDLAVGAARDDDGGSLAGAVWILFLNTDGTVQSEQKISKLEGGFGGDLTAGDRFGAGLAALGDVDGDGVRDLAVGAPLHNEGGLNGALWILFLDTDGTVKSEQKISELDGGFTGTLHPDDDFGLELGSLGDLDQNGTADLAVGMGSYGSGGVHGDVWILLLNDDGTVTDYQAIGQVCGCLNELMEAAGDAARSVAGIGDLNGDGTVDLVVGATGDGGGGGWLRGAAWVLFLADSQPAIGSPFCSPAVPNSTGLPGTIEVLGSSGISDRCLILRATQLPTASNIGYFIMGTGTNTFTPPGSSGPICIAPGIRRYLPPVNNTTQLDGGFKRDVGALDVFLENVIAGSTWGFQAWHRDGASPSNLTDAVRVTFQ